MRTPKQLVRASMPGSNNGRNVRPSVGGCESAEQRPFATAAPSLVLALAGVLALGNSDAVAQATAPAPAKEAAIGYYVPFLWSDSFADVVLKLNKIRGLEQLRCGDIDLLGASSRAELIRRLEQSQDELTLKVYAGIDKKAAHPVGDIVARPVLIEGVPFVLTVVFKSSPGLVLQSPAKTLITPDAPFYLPGVIDKVTLTAVDRVAAAPAFRRIKRRILADYAHYPARGATPRRPYAELEDRLFLRVGDPYNDKEGKLSVRFDADIIIKQADDGSLSLYRCILSHERDTRFVDELDRLYKQHALRIQLEAGDR